jgi:hypothetical protein
LNEAADDVRLNSRRDVQYLHRRASASSRNPPAPRARLRLPFESGKLDHVKEGDDRLFRSTRIRTHLRAPALSLAPMEP